MEQFNAEKHKIQLHQEFQEVDKELRDYIEHLDKDSRKLLEQTAPNQNDVAAFNEWPIDVCKEFVVELSSRDTESVSFQSLAAFWKSLSDRLDRLNLERM